MKRVLLVLFCCLSFSARAELKVFATVPEWGALASEIGGRHVEVFTATTALQDPHHIEARPSLIARARSADLVVATGAGLEVGWLPLVQRESGNPRVQPGRTGYLEAALFVHMLEVPTRLDRADGDVHADGNPHIQSDPRNILKVGEALAPRLSLLDPNNAADYQSRFKNFSERWRTAVGSWEAAAAPLRGMPVVTQHGAFPYLYKWLGMIEAGTLEPRPGVEPSAAQLGRLVAETAARKPRAVIRTAYDSPRPAQWFGERAQVPVVVLPFTVGGNERADDLFGLFDDTVAQLLQVTQAPKANGEGARP